MIVFSPILPWAYLAVFIAALVIVFMLIRGAPGRKRSSRIITQSLSILAAVCLGIAALNPFWVETRDSSRVHLQVALDVSASMMRAEGGWERIRQLNAKRLEDHLSVVGGYFRRSGTAGILTFRDDTASGRHVPLDQLPDNFNRLDRDRFASGSGTHIQEALEQAGRQISRSGGRGAVLLVSDGNQTRGNAVEAANRLARQGIPVYIYPITGGGPALAITAADLPRRIHAGQETHVRGVMYNRGRRKTPPETTITLQRNTGLRDSSQIFGPSLSLERPVSLPAGQWARLRWPLQLAGYGLQHIDLSLRSGAGTVHTRRFYTHVNRPPHILAIGGDNRWITAIPTESILVTQVKPGDFDPEFHLPTADAVVISGVPAHQLPEPALEEIAGSVEKKGIGLMVINGNHPGGEEDTETVLMSYNDSPLEELLPVRSGPQPFMEDAPPRNVVLLIDTSGSMQGRNLSIARTIARYIILNLLRPEDRLDLITFTTGAGHLIKNRSMTDDGKKDALDKLSRISAGGGTDPNRALALVRHRKLDSCGLIFISDGYFGHVGYRPDCRATVFAIGVRKVPRQSPLWKLADPIPVPYDFNPESIIIPYFDPEPRLKFFEPGDFTPQSMAHYLPPALRLPVPSFPLEGAALTYAKEDAILNAVRPKLTDPVLAYRVAGAGYAGVFTTGFTQQWMRLEKGREAIHAWISRIISYTERERYDFKLEDRGNIIDIQVSLNPVISGIPRVHRLNARLVISKNETYDILLKPGKMSPGTFEGQIRIKRAEYARVGRLFLTESGPDALSRAQQVPIVIPPRSALKRTPTTEDFSYGQNRGLLQQIADITGGVYDPEPGVAFFRNIPPSVHGNSLWIYFTTLAALFYITAIAINRWNV